MDASKLLGMGGDVRFDSTNPRRTKEDTSRVKGSSGGVDRRIARADRWPACACRRFSQAMWSIRSSASRRTGNPGRR